MGQPRSSLFFVKLVLTQKPQRKYSVTITDKDGGEFCATGFDSVSISPVTDDEVDLYVLTNGDGLRK